MKKDAFKNNLKIPKQ